MFEWLVNNLGTIVISALLLATVVLVICSMVRQKRKGKSSCGCNCASCALHGQCHTAASKRE